MALQTNERIRYPRAPDASLVVPEPSPTTPRPPKLLDRVREANRLRHVLHQDLPWLDDVVRAKRPKHLLLVLTRDEVRAAITELHGTPRLMATLLYGAGLCLLECCRQKVQDVDFGMNHIVVRDGKGAKDRVTILPAAADQPDLTRGRATLAEYPRSG